MFDPERDHDPGVRPFYVRILAIAMVTAALCVVLWPSVTGFPAGSNHDVNCVAIRDSWHSGVPGPSERELQAVLPAIPTAAQQQNPQFMDLWRSRWQAAQSSPVVVRANNRMDWLENGPGACVSASRHRLMLSGLGLGALLLVTVGLSLVLRRSRVGERHSVSRLGTSGTA